MVYILYAVVVISVLLAISDGNSKNNKYFCVLIGFCLACLGLSYFPSDYIYNRQVEIKVKRDSVKIVEIPDSLRKGNKMSECLKSKLVNTRKHHVCFGCGREIPSGSQAFCETWVDDTINTTYLCRVCESFAGTVLKYGDEYSEHSLPEHNPELWECMRIEIEEGEYRGVEHE